MSSMLTLAGNAAPTGFYDFPIEQSLRFNDDDSAYLSRTPASASNRKTMTFSFWFKRGNFGATQKVFSAGVNSSNNARIDLRADGRLQVFSNTSGVQDISIVFDPIVFRDISAFYHFTVIIDTTSAIQTDRVQLFVNGTRHTGISSTGGENIWPDQNDDTQFNTTVEHNIGRQYYSANAYYDGYLAEINFIDGQALDPTSFGETKSGIWIPKDTAGLTFGTNGFRLAFADGAAIGDDTSGNTNDFTANNLVASDVVLDSPTNNFCTYNPNSRFGGNGTFSEGNLRFSGNSSGDMSTRTSTVIPVGMKFYFEAIYSEEAGSGGQARLGIDQTGSTREREKTGTGLFSFDFRGSAGVPQAYDENTVTTYGSQPAEGDVVGIAVDLENGKLYAHKANSYYNSGDPVAGTGAVITGIPDLQSVVFMSIDGGVNRNNWHINFGQDSTFANLRAAGGNADENGLGDFAHPVPSGFLSLCSANLPSGAIDTLADETPEDYFNTALFSATSGVAGSVTGYGFAPDWIWTKARNTAQSHQLFDNVRGDGVRLITNSTGAEADLGASYLSLEADGFDYGTGTFTSNTYVGWGWKANGAGVSNTDGSITSTVSVGATSQQNWFSVVSYTGNGTAGATVGHGLGGTVPDMYIVKSRDNARDWRVYHSSLGATKALQLNKTDAANTSSAFWNNTEPTSSVFSIGNVTTVNGSGEDYICYAFANAEGLCKVGSYIGNGSTDGVFVATGHRPAWIMVKRLTSGAGWSIFDNTRNSFNPSDAILQANTSNSEGTSYPVDFLSNGFKMRNSDSTHNQSGTSYLFLSIAEQPFAFANAR